MSGHSKWSTIKRKTGANDAKRASVFTKIGREIAVAVKSGGGDPASNSKLRDLIAKAKSNNVPNDNIDRLIKKCLGDGDKSNYEEMIYEGYGPCGVAVIVRAATDSRNRTAGNVRHYFDKFGGNMGNTGCVSYLFSDCGTIVIEDEDGELEEDKVMEASLEAGASDFAAEEGAYIIKTEPSDLDAVRDALVAAGYEIASCEIEKVPSTYVTLTGEDDIKHMNLLLEYLEDDDDVTEVFHNWENCED